MSKNTCSIEGCATDSRARGMCFTHYQQQRRANFAPVPVDPMVKIEARFWSKVDMSGDCWKWLGSHGKHGHGTFSMFACLEPMVGPWGALAGVGGCVAAGLLGGAPFILYTLWRTRRG